MQQLEDLSEHNIQFDSVPPRKILLSNDIMDPEVESSSLTMSQSEKSKRTILPAIGDKIKCNDPDTGEIEEFVMMNRAGKSGGKYKNWYNVRNLRSGICKSIDFSVIYGLERIINEVLFNACNSSELLKAQNKALEK